MRFAQFILLLFFCTFSAQQNSVSDSFDLKNADDLFVDDYGNVYLYKNSDFSFTKYDSLGHQLGKLMFTLPFKIQSVQNPLNIPAFSENAQELRFYDQNLNEIQLLNLRQKFGFVKMAYAEDQQQVWLIEESTKRLIQYNFREDRVIAAFPFNMEPDAVIDLLVHEGVAYILTQDTVAAYGFNADKIFEIPVSKPKRLRRENGNIIVQEKQQISVLRDGTLQILFGSPAARIVDKNSAAYFEIRGNKLYLYPIKK